jgi:hypothetical protein
MRVVVPCSEGKSHEHRQSDHQPCERRRRRQFGRGGNEGQESGDAGNSLAGILGGGIGGAILQALGLAGADGAIDIEAILQNVASGGVGGGVVMAIIAALKGILGTKSK